MHMLVRVKICILQIRTCDFSMYITLIQFYLAFVFELSFGPHVLKESDSCYSESLLLHFTEAELSIFYKSIFRMFRVLQINEFKC